MKNPHRILGLDPGIRQMGVAVIEGDNLLYFGVEVLRRPGDTRRVILRRGGRVVSRMIRDFRPGTLAVERTCFPRNPSSKTLNDFSEVILRVGRKRKLRVVSLASNSIKKHLTGSGRAKKSEVAAIVVSRYPHLAAYLNERPKWKQAFHANMFDAVAVCLAARGVFGSTMLPCRES